MQVEDDRKKADPNKMRVRVAIRIRPMNPKEQAKQQSQCIVGQPGGRLIIGTDKQFKFDSVFPPKCQQERVYKQCVHDLVLSCFDGYNAAVLAYGQTGSGKTFTMGTANVGVSQEELGIIPRVIRELFNEVQKRKSKIDFIIKASFLQIYNQQILDLLTTEYVLRDGTHPSTAAIREEKDGSISIYGIIEEKVTTAQQMLGLLERGATHRTTASTLMNDASSRSHAIFTIFIEQHYIQDLYNNSPTEIQQGFVTAKFHFVDLAGSERIKKTGATGSTLREGININMGLLCLGNVISALTDPQNKGGQRFVPYRDSKLTRILQDSLGGNSNTYMIACVSPAQSNFQESLNTLKYAARAMNIKNTPVVNRDPQSAMISQLKQKLFEVENENKRLRVMMGQGCSIQDLNNMSFRHKNAFDESQREQTEQIKRTVVQLEHRLTVLNEQLTVQKHKSANQELQILQTHRQKDILRMQMEDLFTNNPELRYTEIQENKVSVLDIQLQTIASLKGQLIEKQRLYGLLQLEYERIVRDSKRDEEMLVQKSKQVYDLKKEVVKLYKKKDQPMTSRHTINQSFLLGGITSRLNTVRQTQDIFQDNARLEFQAYKNRRYTEIEQNKLEDDHVYMSGEKEYELEQESANHQLLNVSTEIHEKQKLLKEITNRQVELEYQLIAEMREEYHKKIMGLEKEKEKLERDMAMIAKGKEEKILTMIEKDKAVQSLKAKKEALEAQLKEFRKKQKEQHNLEKLVQDQKSRIGELSKEIKTFKLQKLELNKKIKEDKEKFQKFKAQRYKELMLVKKSNIEKEQELRKMARESQKTQQSLLRKQEQARQLKKVNQTLKEFLEPKPRGTKRGTLFMGSPANMATNSINFQNIVNKTMQRLTNDVQRQTWLTKYAEEVDSLQNELDKYLNKDMKVRVEMERLNAKLRSTDQQVQKLQIEQKKKELENKHNQLAMIIESLQDKMEYSTQKLQQVRDQQGSRVDLDTQLIYNKTYDSVESLRRLLKIFLQRLIVTLSQQFSQRKQNNQLKAQIQSQGKKIEELDEQIIRMTMQHQEAVSQLRQEMMIMQQNMIIEEEQPSQTIPIINHKKVEDKNEKKLYQRKINDLNKKVNQLTKESEQLRRKCQVVSTRYENIKKFGNKDRFIGIGSLDDFKIPTLKEKRAQRNSVTPMSSTTLAHLNNNSMLLDEVSDIWTGLNSSTSLASLTKIKPFMSEERRIHTEIDESKETENKWECIATLQGHASAIYSLAYFSNCLISTATRNLKIWDLEAKRTISDISGQSVSGTIRSVVVDTHSQNRPLMVTACDKIITLWDLVDMKPINTFRSHKDDVRTLYLCDGYLFSGGKGTINTPSLYIWDLRMMAAIDQKQRNQDVFCITSYRNTLYYGTRNHQVRRLNLQNAQVMQPFQNPHFDAVTGVATLNSYLISGSRDRNLKIWNLQSPNSHYKYTSYGHNDQINSVIRDNCLPIFYSGSKDGYVKAGMINKQKIEFVGNVHCHPTASVSTLCPFGEGESICGFASGSSDKTVKIWKATSETIDTIQSQILYQNS